VRGPRHERDARPATTKLVRLRLDEGIGDIVIEPPQRNALVIVLAGGRAIGQVRFEGVGVHPAAEIRAAVAEELGDRVARDVIGAEARLALRGDANRPAPPRASVVVCTRSRPELLERCLQSIAELEVAPAEVIVVDNAPADRRTGAVCAQRPVRYVAAGGVPLSVLRTRGVRAARGELVAFVDDDCIVEPVWLNDLGEAFADPLCAAVIGYVGPLELATAAQCWFEAHGGFEMSFEPRLIDGAISSPALAASPLGTGNVVFRRAALERVGVFDDRLGPGTPSRSKEDAALFFRLLLAGERVAFDPARVVWHRHRRSRRELRRVLHDYAAGDGAYAALCMVEYRQLDARELWRWWWRTHLPNDLRRLRRRDPDAVPPDCVLAEAVGTLRGPAAFLLTRRRRRQASRLASRRVTAAGVHAGPARAPASVVVPSHNRRDQLLEVLDGLGRQTMRDAMEVVVVLDGCGDGSAEAVRAVEWPFPLKVVEQPALGVAAARNRAAVEASYDLLVLLDDDIVPAPDLVAEHVSAAAAGELTLTMGRHPPPAPSGDPLEAMLRAWWEDHFRRKGQAGRPWSFLDFASGNSALSRALLLDTGGFDERFSSRAEDYELAIRLLDRGVKFRYVPSALGEHRVDASLATTVAKCRMEGRTDVLIARRHPHVFQRLRLSRVVAGEVDAEALRLAFSAPECAHRDLLDRMQRADRSSRIGLRTGWLRAVVEAHALAFALGVRDEIGTPGALRALAAAAPMEGDAPARLTLEPGGGLEALPSTGTSVVTVWRGGTPLTQVRGVDGGDQWDADVLAERVAGAVSAVAGRQVAAEVLDGSASS
jgi:GT2 family glycosyltransferase